MKTKYYPLLTILFIVMIFALGCAPQQQKPETPSAAKINPNQTSQQTNAKDDFGCWPPSCGIIPYPEGQKLCMDWKAGKPVSWPDCNFYSEFPACVKLCEFEKKNNPQDSQNFPDYNSQQQDSNSNFDPNSFDSNQDQQQPIIPTGIPASDPEAGSVYIYISDQASGCVERCNVYSSGQIDSRIIRIDDMTGKNWVSFGTFGKGVNQFSNPNHLTVGPNGKIYIADSQNDRIVRIDDMTGKGWITYGVSGRTGEPNTPSQIVLPPGEGRLVQPSSVRFDSKGRIYILSGSELARIDDMTGKGWTTFGSAGSGVNKFFKGKALAIDSMDKIYFVDAGNHRIVRIDDMTGKGWTTFGTKGSGIGQFEDEVNAVTLDSQGRIYIGDEHNNRIVRIDDMAGKGWVEFGGLTNDTFNQPHAFGITKAGHIYILDTVNHRIVRIDDMTGKGWIAFAPYANAPPENDYNWRMEAPHGMFVVERN